MMWRILTLAWAVVMWMNIFTGGDEARTYATAILAVLSLGIDDILKAIRNDREGK